jgi:hypothetical protein
LLENAIPVSRLADHCHVGLAIDQQRQSLMHGCVIIGD